MCNGNPATEFYLQVYPSICSFLKNSNWVSCRVPLGSITDWHFISLHFIWSRYVGKFQMLIVTFLPFDNQSAGAPKAKLHEASLNFSIVHLFSGRISMKAPIFQHNHQDNNKFQV